VVVSPGVVERKVVGITEVVIAQVGAVHVHGRLLPWQIPLVLQYDALFKDWQNISPHWSTAAMVPGAKANTARAQRNDHDI